MRYDAWESSIGKYAKKLPIGQMAELNCVSDKTLRFYQEKGLLEPSVIDAESGRRYYALEQSYVLDRILRYQYMGFSLGEMTSLLNDDIDSIPRIPTMEKRLEEIRRQKIELEALEESIEHRLESMTRNSFHDASGTCKLEWHKARCRIDFDLGNHGYEMEQTYDELSAFRWCYVLRLVKKDMKRRNIPLVLFDNVCNLVSVQHVQERRPFISKACVLVNEKFAPLIEGSAIVPAGLCVTCSFDTWSLENVESAERFYFNKMLDFIEEKDLRVRDSYWGECNIESINKDAYSKLFIPVDLPAKE